MTVFEVTNECSGGHENDCGFATFAGAKSTKTVLAAFGFPVAMTNEVTERAKVAVGLNDNVAAITTVASVRAATGNKRLPPETAAAVSTVARTTIQDRPIRKHFVLVFPLML